MGKMVIYKTINLINGKIYIGQTANDNKNYYGSGVLLRKAINKYGKDNFSKEIICECNSLEELDSMEIFWIYTLNSRNQNIGYNIGTGGERRAGKKLTLEHRRKVSENHADVSGDKNPMFGKTHSKKAKKAIKDARTDSKASKITKQKMSESKKGEKNNKAKLTESDVLLIRKLFYEDNIPQYLIAEQFNIERPCIYKIIHYKTWKHIP